MNDPRRSTRRRCAAAAARTIALLAALALAGCPGHDHDHAADDHQAHDEAPPTNRIDIPPAVRRNLGITFASVQRRDVERTIRVPGRFEPQPLARREYRTMLPGRVELVVDQYQPVAQGDLLYRLDSTAWRRIQQQLSDLDARIARLDTKLSTFEPLMAAHARHEQSLAETLDLWRERVGQLEAVREAGGGAASELAAARTSVASTESQLADVQEKDATLQAALAETAGELRAARAQRDFQLTSAASIAGVPVELLTAESADGRPGWATIDRLEIRAARRGVVEALNLTSGGWADEKALVLTTIQPDRLRFHAKALQSDLGHFREGLPARIVAPAPTRAAGAIDLEASMTGTVSLGVSGDPEDRTFDLYVVPDELADWARPGVTAQLEVIIEQTDVPELAVPLAAVQRDGITPVLFRRDPRNPDAAIRINADLGIDDGRWVEVRSGLRDGDEVVLDGSYQLMLALSRTVTLGGHFHADGTFHAEDEH